MAEASAFGQWVRRRRKALDLTQEALAHLVGCALITIQKIEAEERRPSRQVAERLADSLGISSDERELFIKVARAERLVERLTAPDTPPTRYPSPEASRGRLPTPATLLVGRESLLAEATSLLRQPGVRLVTLTGAGGTGKTRLAVEVAAALEATYADGAWFVALASLTDAALVAATIAQTLGVASAGEGVHLIQPEERQDLEARLVDYLRPRELLLVLDNFEQVLAAAPLVAELLAAAPRLTLLVTSRFVLRLAGEYELLVPPLALPDPDAPLELLAQAEAVRLFAERSRAVRPQFALTPTTIPVVAAICRHLDGLPLAIELAAVRGKLLPPQALLSRLNHRLAFLSVGRRDADSRQQTLRATIDWSYSLLKPAEQRLFARLSVFAGGCTLEAAEEVCGAGLLIDSLDGLASLVDKSLLLQTEEGGSLRLAMLETLREYALERLGELGERDAIGVAHADYYLRLAESVPLLGPEPGAPKDPPWITILNSSLALLDREQDNLRAALSWLHDTSDKVSELRLVAALWPYWAQRSKWAEGYAAAERALSTVPSDTQRRPLAGALLGAGLLGFYSGTRRLVQERLAASAELWRGLDEPRHLAHTLDCLVFIQVRRSHGLEEAWAYADEAAAICRAASDRWALGWAQLAQAHVANLQGEYGRFHSLTGDAIASFEATGDDLGLAEALTSMGWSYAQCGEYRKARTYFERSGQIRRSFPINSLGERMDYLTGLSWIASVQADVPSLTSIATSGLALAEVRGDRGGMIWFLTRLGWAAWLEGDNALARERFSAAQTLYESLSIDWYVWAELGLGYVALSEGDLDAAGERCSRALEHWREYGFTVDIAIGLSSMGHVALARGDLLMAEAYLVESVVMSARYNDRWILAVGLELTAALIAASGRAGDAARLIGAAAALREELETPAWPVHRELVKHALTEACRILGPEAVDAALAAGRLLPLEEAAALASIRVAPPVRQPRP